MSSRSQSEARCFRLTLCHQSKINWLPHTLAITEIDTGRTHEGRDDTETDDTYEHLVGYDYHCAAHDPS